MAGLNSEGIELEERSPLTAEPSSSNSNNRKTPARGVFTSPAIAIATFLFAAAQNEIGMVQNLLDEETVRVNDCDYDKRTALHVASAEGHIEVVRILVREGADVNVADRYNATPLDDAIHHGQQEVAKLLIESGAKHGVGSNFGLDLVHAAGNGDLKNVIKLVEGGIPVSSADFDLRTPLHLAISGRHEQVVKYLLQKGADLHAEDRFGGTPLEEAHRAGVRLGEDPILNMVMEALGSREHTSWRVSLTNPFFLTFFTIEVTIGILFAIFSKYGEGATAGEPLDQGLPVITQRHPFYMDVHVMIFIGFGFLMTFLRKYGYTAVGLTFILGSLSIQVYQLSSTFWQNVINDNWVEVEITVEKLIMGDFAAGAVLISFGALLGKVTFTQMLLLSVFEVFFYSLNEAISLKMQIADIGGSMVIHVFGAFFGLASSKILTPKSARGNRDNSAVYHADVFSMIGTVFLWIFWPSFNGALSEGNNQHRAVINTVLSLTASCVFAFMFSQFWRREKLFNMVDIQNATLAGGVAMGSSADMAIHPGFALLVGAVAGTISVFGFAILQGFVENHLQLHDTCGVLNLHGIPGLIGGFVSAITTASFGPGHDYNPQQLHRIYSAAPGRHPSEQAKLQIAFLFITFGISIGTGFLCSTMLSRLAYPKKFFLDSTSFETPAREVPYFFDKRGEARHSSEKSSDAPAVTPAIAQQSGGSADTDRIVADLQNKVNYLENSLRSHRKTLREQARVIEGITGQRPSLARTMTEEESQFMLASPRAGGFAGPSSPINIPRGPAAQFSAAQSGPSPQSMQAMLENLTRQRQQQEKDSQETARLLHSLSEKLDNYIAHHESE